MNIRNTLENNFGTILSSLGFIIMIIIFYIGMKGPGFYEIRTIRHDGHLMIYVNNPVSFIHHPSCDHTNCIRKNINEIN